MATRDRVRVQTPEEANAERIADERAEWAEKLKDHKNEFTTEEVLAKMNATQADGKTPMMGTREIEAFRQRMAFEHMKAETDPPECPGFFVTRNGNLRRDY